MVEMQWFPFVNGNYFIAIPCPIPKAHLSCSQTLIPTNKAQIGLLSSLPALSPSFQLWIGLLSSPVGVISKLPSTFGLLSSPSASSPSFQALIGFFYASYLHFRIITGIALICSSLYPDYQERGNFAKLTTKVKIFSDSYFVFIYYFVINIKFFLCQKS